jgi:hypothetical protein
MYDRHRTSSISRTRTFKVVQVKYNGRVQTLTKRYLCRGARPSQAAKKASTKICQDLKVKQMTITIQETSKSSKKRCFTYSCIRKKKKKPTHIGKRSGNGKEVSFKYTTICKAQKANMMGGGKIGLNYSILCHGCIDTNRANSILIPQNMEVHFYTEFGECLMVSSISAKEICQFVNEKGILKTFYGGEEIPNFYLFRETRPTQENPTVYTGNSTITRCRLPGGDMLIKALFTNGTSTTLKSVLQTIIQDHAQESRRTNIVPKIHVHCLFCALPCEENATLPRWIKKLEGTKMDVDMTDERSLQFTGQKHKFYLL